MSYKFKFFLKNLARNKFYKSPIIVATGILFLLGICITLSNRLGLHNFKDFFIPKNSKDNVSFLNKTYKFTPRDTNIFAKQIDNKEFVLNWSKKILNQAQKRKPISREFFSYIPKNINQHTVHDKKKIFISILLPIALKGNEVVLKERKLIDNAFRLGNISAIKFFATKYKTKNYKIINFKEIKIKQLEKIKYELLNKVNKIPISMILAQAIIESGWGSSRFAKEGNALFGEWVWHSELGIKPEKNSDANFSVKSFNNIMDSVNSYILNINRHLAYEGLRKYRQVLAKKGDTITGYEAANFLNGYAEIGYQYVTKVKEMIVSNNLSKFENAVLE